MEVAMQHFSREISQASWPRRAVESPFLDTEHFVDEELEPEEQQESPAEGHWMDTPFSSAYELAERDGMAEPGAEEATALVAELYDEEFDEAVFELINEAADLYETRFHGELGAPSAQAFEAERLLERHYAPLVREAETLLETIANGVAQQDLDAMSETELETFFGRYKPRPSQLSPSFENFFGRIVKKVAKVAKKVGRAATRLGLGPILNRLKALIKPLLKRVLQSAIKKLPVALQPHAQKLAARLPFLKETAEEAAFEEDNDTTQDVSEIQHEFDAQIAHLLYVEDRIQQEVALAGYMADAEPPTADPLGDLDHARAQFVGQIGKLKEGEDPTPLVENFVPAILPALRLGIKLAGRKKVVNFLAKFVARLIRRFTGPRYTPPLSQAIVDAGLRLISLETRPEDEARTANEAVAATIEGMVRRVAGLPEYVLDDEELLEGFVLEAFEHAAVANLPPVLPERVYEKRPDLRETTSLNGAWVYWPRPMRNGVSRYCGKKYTRVPEVMLTPHIAQAVTTFGGVPLAVFLRDRLGILGRPIKARVHLYEAIPGTWLSRISKYERNVPGLGTAAKFAWSQFHPLTSQAAGMLFREPGLGRDVSAKYLADPLTLSVGQRFYYLEIPGVRPAMVPNPNGLPVLRRAGRVHLTLDFPGDQLRVFMFLSEAEAQAIAVKLRQQAPIGVVMTALRSLLKGGLKAAFSEGMYRHVNILHEAVAPEQLRGPALNRLPPIAQKMLGESLMDWLGRSLREYFQQRARDFIAATEDLTDGVTVIATFSNPPGFSTVRKMLRGESVALDGLWGHDGTPAVDIKVVPGYRHA
jgi:hypothetical protein